MKKLSLLAVLALACGSLMAQDDKPKDAPKDAPKDQPGERRGQRGQRGEAAQRMLERMTQELNLTDEQKGKVKAVFDSESEKARAVFQDSALSQEQRREKMQALRTESNGKLKEILTKEQFEKWEKMREEMRSRGQGRGPGRPAPSGDAPEKKNDSK